MLRAQGEDRLRISGAYVPALLDALEDMRTFEQLANDVQYGGLIPRLYGALDGRNRLAAETWRAAWTTLALFWIALDGLEDGDVITMAPGRNWTETSRMLGSKYNRAVSLFMLSSAILDNLDSDTLGHSKVAALRRLFNDCALRTVSGQQADLDIDQSVPPDKLAPVELDDFARLAQIKSGAVYELAFGGTALLVTMDPRVVGPIQFAGLVYGTLLQFGDDVTDAAQVSESPLTLSRTYDGARDPRSPIPLAADLRGFLQFTYATYRARVDEAIAPLPEPIRNTIGDIFAYSFERNPHVSVMPDQ